MVSPIFRVDRPAEYRKAGPTDLIELLPAPGGHPLFLLRWIVETLVYAIVRHEFIHLSGPTGSAKSALLEALWLVPENFQFLCEASGFPVKPLHLYPVELAVYEAPGELFERRALKDGTTYDEMSGLVLALQHAAEHQQKVYPLIWLREMGRVHSASIQGGLLNLLTKNEILLPDGSRVNGSGGIAWVADSNYQAEQDCNHILVELDDALRRRFSVNLTLDYLTAEQEVNVVKHLLQQTAGNKPDQELISKVVKLGQIVRRQRLEGNLQSVVPPTIYGYLSFLRMAQSLACLSMQQIAMATMLGNVSLEDRKLAFGLLNELFGLQSEQDEDPTGGNLF
jgi:hypothetical protein